MVTSSTGNSFSYDIQATIGGGDTGVNRVAITVPGSFGAPTITGVQDDGVGVAYTDNTSGNAISVDLTTKITASSKITVLFDSDAPTTHDLTGVNFTSTVDDSATGDAAQATTEGNGDGDAGDSNSWKVTTTDAAGPIAHWTFDEGTGQTAADSAGTNDGTLGSTAGADAEDPSWTCVVGGTALTFDGSDDYVDAGSAASLDIANGSVAAWFKADIAQVNEHVIVDKNQGGNNDGDFIFMIQDSDDTPNPNHVRLFLENGTSSVSIFADAPVTFVTWTHAVVTFGSSGMAMYINGVKQADTNANTSGMDNTVPSLLIGRQATQPIDSV